VKSQKKFDLNVGFAEKMYLLKRLKFSPTEIGAVFRDKIDGSQMLF